MAYIDIVHYWYKKEHVFLTNNQDSIVEEYWIIHFLNTTNVLRDRVNCYKNTFILTLFWRVLRDLRVLSSCGTLNHNIVAATQECHAEDTWHDPHPSHNIMTCSRHRTWHIILSKYIDTGHNWKCAIYWCGKSNWNSQLPILMSWVSPVRYILPQLSFHTKSRLNFTAAMVAFSEKLGSWSYKFSHETGLSNLLHYPLRHMWFYIRRFTHY